MVLEPLPADGVGNLVRLAGALAVVVVEDLGFGIAHRGSGRGV
jgi:hypothetical protein